MLELEPEDIHKPTKEIIVQLHQNQPIIVKSDGDDSIYRFRAGEFKSIRRSAIGKTRIKPKNLEQDFAVDILCDPTISSVAIIGSAGSGKTLLAVASAISQKNTYSQILVARPAVELSDKTLGFLPGTLEEKYNPYLAPIRSACRLISEAMDESSKHKDQKCEQKFDASKWMEEHGIELLPLSTIRGDTFNHAFIIVDEAQNLTPIEVKTIVSRAGDGTKVVFTGDINQIDIPYLSKESNGLSHLIDRFRGKDYFAYIEMKYSVRSALAEQADKLL